MPVSPQAHPPGPSTPSGPWRAVVPVRGSGTAKSRLGRTDRAALARAFLEDVLRALRDAPAIDGTVVVTSDPDLAGIAAEAGATTLPDPDRGLNAAIGAGLASAPGRDAIVVLADLPCLDGSIIEAVLAGATVEAASGCASFVPDAAGTGTTMLALPAGSSCTPRFGEHSRAAHAAQGARTLDLPGLAGARARRDVDTEVDLWDALRLGAGPATRRATGP